MFNLLRMDLYRMRRGKSVYVCLAILLVGVAVTLGMVSLVATPQGRELAVRIGLFTAQDLAEESDVLDGVDTLVMLRQSGIEGGMYNMVFGIWVMLFVCMDYQSGFIKNIMAVHQNRWKYVAAKIMTAGVVNICYLVMQYVVVLGINRLLGDMVPMAAFADVLFYFSWAWLLTTAFAAMVIMVCVWFRSVAAGALAAILFGTGMIVGPLSSLLNMVHMGAWMRFTIYLTMDMGPGHCASLSDLYVYGVGAGFLILYASIAGIVLKKQDV